MDWHYLTDKLRQEVMRLACAHDIISLHSCERICFKRSWPSLDICSIHNWPNFLCNCTANQHPQLQNSLDGCGVSGAVSGWRLLSTILTNLLWCTFCTNHQVILPALGHTGHLCQQCVFVEASKHPWALVLRTIICCTTSMSVALMRLASEGIHICMAPSCGKSLGLPVYCSLR